MRTGRRHILHLAGLILALAARAVCAEDAKTNETAIAFPDVAEDIVIIEFQKEQDAGRALGVIVRMDGKTYILTNQHVLLGADNLRFTSAAGTPLKPRSVELSNNRDLARLALPDHPTALELAKGKAKMNTPITLVSPGQEKAERMKSGSIIGIGGMKFEVSAPFGEEENGAPVLNTEGRIVGLASHTQESSRHAMKKGTRFEDAERHFCYRVDNPDWQRVNWRKYNKVFGSAYHDHKALGDEIISIFKNSKGKVDSNQANGLVSECRTHALQIQRLTAHRGMTDYLLNELEQQAELFEFAEKHFSKQTGN